MPLRIILYWSPRVGEDNPLRFVLLGSSHTYYHRGELKQRNVFPGALQSLALLTVRCAYELTQVQDREADSWYSNADCVILEGNRTPRYWDDCGIEYSVKGRGRALIDAIGAYKIGEVSTIPYEWYQQHSVLRPSLPSELSWPGYHEQLLAA